MTYRMGRRAATVLAVLTATSVTIAGCGDSSGGEAGGDDSVAVSLITKRSTARSSPDSRTGSTSSGSVGAPAW